MTPSVSPLPLPIWPMLSLSLALVTVTAVAVTVSARLATQTYRAPSGDTNMETAAPFARTIAGTHQKIYWDGA